MIPRGINLVADESILISSCLLYVLLSQEKILDFPYTERLDGLFHPLSLKDSRAHEKQETGIEVSIRAGFVYMQSVLNLMYI